MKLSGKVSKRFREKHFCNLCDVIFTTFKPKCYVQDDGDVEYVCKKCHDKFCLECDT